jgi:hypothetical protein
MWQAESFEHLCAEPNLDQRMNTQKAFRDCSMILGRLLILVGK